jgi:hypothetical protein
MIDENKAIYSIYESTASINNTTRHNSSYNFSPTEYSIARQEQEENNIKQKIVSDLEYCLANSKVGKKENYFKIISAFKKIQEELNALLS